MGQLESLSDELLLDIALRLQPPNLKNLTLSARQFRGIAQEALHTSVSLKLTYNTLPELIRTLVQRPDVALKIRSLSIAVDRGATKVYSRKVLGENCWDQVVTRAKLATQSWNIIRTKTSRSLCLHWPTAGVGKSARTSLIYLWALR